MKEYKQRAYSVTKKMTVEDDGKTLVVRSTSLGYPIRFELNDELRQFLKDL